MQAAAKQITGEFAKAREDSDRDYAVRVISDRLEQVAPGEDVAWCLSDAMARVDGYSRGPHRRGPITPVQRDMLLVAVVRACAGAAENLPRRYPRSRIDDGMRALAGQIMLWAEAREQSAGRDRGTISDLHDRARIFRNDMHNFSLVEGIARRAHKRRADRIQDLLAGARLSADGRSA